MSTVGEVRQAPASRDGNAGREQAEERGLGAGAGAGAGAVDVAESPEGQEVWWVLREMCNTAPSA